MGFELFQCDEVRQALILAAVFLVVTPLYFTSWMERQKRFSLPGLSLVLLLIGALPYTLLVWGMYGLVRLALGHPIDFARLGVIKYLLFLVILGGAIGYALILTVLLFAYVRRGEVGKQEIDASEKSIR